MTFSPSVLTENRIENQRQFSADGWEPPNTGIKLQTWNAFPLADGWEPPNTGIKLQTWNAFSLQTPQYYHPTGFVLYKERKNCKGICKETI
jgi:hypothetical protein